MVKKDSIVDVKKGVFYMSEKRRDTKGRILRTGESQRKDGRYVYKYVDTYGKPQFVYAWKLTAADKTPAGKRDGISLREKINSIQKDLNDGIDLARKKMTVCQLYAKHIGYRKNVRRKTEKGRQCLMNILKHDPLGTRSIDSIRMSDAKEWVIRMSENGYAYKTINNYKCSLKAVFCTAIEENCVRKNPFNFALNTILRDDSKRKTALTPKQEEELIDFAKNDKVYQKYADELIILLGTGLRISEFCGLTEDLDLKNRVIQVDHQLMKDAAAGYYIETPKTPNGVRQIPMSEEVYQALSRTIQNRGKAKPIKIGGYENFLFLTQSGFPKTAANYESMLKGLVKKYNKSHEEKLPDISPHILRHTFCTRLANAGMNPKALQYIMGHSNIGMTLDYYAHATFDSAKQEMKRFTA